MRKRLALLVALAIVPGACTGVPPAASPGGTDASPTPAAASATPAATGAGPAVSAGGVLPSLEPETMATMLAAAQAELEVRRLIRHDAGIAEALGPDGAEVLAASDAAAQEFGEEQLAALVEELQVDLTAGVAGRQFAAIGPVSLPPPSAADEWSGSLLGATSFSVTMFMSFAPQMFPQATSPTPQTQKVSHSKTYDLESGDTRESLVLNENLTVTVGGGRVLMDVTLSATSTLTNLTTGARVASRTSTSVGHFEMNGCPAEDGAAQGQYSLANTETITPAAGGGRGGSSATTGSFSALDGDDAHLLHTDFDAGVAASSQGGPSGDWSASATFPMRIPASSSVTGIQIGAPQGISEHNTTAANGASLSSMLLQAGYYLGEAVKQAERFWRSGACIELRPSDDSRVVDPNEQLSITVESKHKFDGATVDAPIKSTFSGKQTLEPDGEPQDAPATLSFTAGPEQGDRGNIELEQVGRRGIGRKTVEFTVAPSDYRVTALVPGMGGFTGTKCDGLAGGWTLNWSSQGGGSGTTTFTLDKGGGAVGQAVSDYRLDAGGGASSHWKLKGTASVSQPEDSPAILHLDLGRGTVTVTAQGQSFTSETAGLAQDLDLEQGDFCD